jgi:molybdate transport system ATP-binding protein
VGLSLGARLARRGLDVTLDLADGERVALLGPNGAGKSTLLQILAGVLRPEEGRAELDGRVLFDLGHGRPRWRPPWDRGVAMLAQEPLLFPHLDALDNVAFGPRSAGAGRAVARAAARRWLAEVDMTAYAGRRPDQLSGGQAQRVAVARALAAEPRLLLLDEPLAALDVTAAPQLRRVLRRVLTGRPALIVTHDLLDASLLTHRVVVLDGGRVVESGPTVDVLRHPRSRFAARLAGLNLVPGVAVDHAVRHSDRLRVEGIPTLPLTPGEQAVAVFSPTAVAVYLHEAGGSPRNAVPVTIAELEPRDDLVRVRADADGDLTLTADVTLGVVGELDLHPGQRVVFSIKATAVSLYPV